jgi:hypothetical protein
MSNDESHQGDRDSQHKDTSFSLNPGDLSHLVDGEVLDMNDEEQHLNYVNRFIQKWFGGSKERYTQWINRKSYSTSDVTREGCYDGGSDE